ncbi:MAG: hypothetical protein CL920_37275 [Deltaproteobacteria bacterium]|nr:hypothetical protein [Deltaproteobacteria bacterium]MBU54384.1 hypothetical protein [Deltaproteobacteria bacterium]|tara:strand:- start:176 stop:928 length:753 start_codon:yes stop_codon:yes gene_type:complete
MAQSAIVDQLIKRFNNAESIHKTYGSSLSKSLDGLFVESTKDAKPVSSTFLDYQFSLVKHIVDELAAADRDVIRESGEDIDAINFRDRVNVETREGTSSLKQTLGGIFGEEILNTLGLNGPIASDPVVLSRTLKSAYEISLELKEMPKPTNSFMPKWEVGQLQGMLKGLSGKLGDAITKTNIEKKETQEAQIKRRELLSKARNALISFDHLLENYARLVGNTELVSRIRPTGGRPKKNNDTPAPPVNPVS